MRCLGNVSWNAVPQSHDGQGEAVGSDRAPGSTAASVRDIA